MDRFHTDFLANDFTEAIHHFEKAASINSNNYKSLVNLARLFAETGAFYKAKPILEQVLRANPGDTNAEALHRFIGENLAKAVPSLDDAVAEIETRRELTPEGEQVRRIFDPTASSGAAQVDRAKLEAFLVGFESMNGYKCSSVLTRDGQQYASHTRGMVPKDRFTKFLQEIYQCSGTRRADGHRDLRERRLDTPRCVAMAEWKGYVVGSRPPREKGRPQRGRREIAPLPRWDKRHERRPRQSEQGSRRHGGRDRHPDGVVAQEILPAERRHGGGDRLN
jgi:hypothetical protein